MFIIYTDTFIFTSICKFFVFISWWTKYLNFAVITVRPNIILHKFYFFASSTQKLFSRQGFLLHCLTETKESMLQGRYVHTFKIKGQKFLCSMRTVHKSVNYELK